MEKVGIIKSISRKEGGRNAFCLTDSPQWYNGYELKAEKGDKISFSVKVNGDFHNFSDVVVMPKDFPITESEKVVGQDGECKACYGKGCHKCVALGGEYPNKSNYTTDQQIAAQVILKGAVELLRGGNVRGDNGSRQTGEVLCELVQELTGAYNLALHNMKTL
jgi:hypothetical protein